jgi:hypothetical protein
MTQKYDPAKRYTWTPEDKFEISGEQFGLVLNAVRAILSTPEAARIMMLDKANSAIEDILANAVEQGIVIEADKPPTEPSQLKVVN